MNKCYLQRFQLIGMETATLAESARTEDPGANLKGNQHFYLSTIQPDLEIKEVRFFLVINLRLLLSHKSEPSLLL